MTSMRQELSANFDAFTASWKAELAKSVSALDSHQSIFLESYSRITSLNAWRNNLLENIISPQSLEFFAEAINDALVSHVLARFGSWRSALMSLRSCIENTYYCLYYMDHPIEQRLWESGHHRPAFSEIHSYMERHPEITAVGKTPTTGLELIKSEYGILSRAVHASAKSFRMSPGVHNVALWTPDATSLGRWRTRERYALRGLNLLLTTVFRTSLSTTQQPGLRKALAFVIPNSMHVAVKKTLGVTIPALP